jgi:hypothetical protein
MQYLKKTATLVKTPPISSEKFGCYKVCGSEYVLQNSSIYLKLDFCHWQQIILVALLNVTDLGCSFLRICLPNSHI